MWVSNVVLVALYEQNDKPSSALEFIQQKLGSPSVLITRSFNLRSRPSNKGQ
ncbi:unnamed protein product [Brassica napus]|uniref:(rape) hypothetical protein n=1 Tax=Brassica napus TaxID=3708 RepID=A0A816NLM2_BRANA|nr:unnamed protein product [Brassica napus]